MTGTRVPAPRGILVGRDADLKGLSDRLLAAHGRLVTVTGCGGVGKTSLALAVARQVGPDFPDGAWLADLSSLRSPGAVAGAVATAIGVREAPETDALNAIRESLQAQQALLVLDNCEHLMDATASVVDSLLDACAGLRILATSREPMGIAGEETFVLAPLALPPQGGIELSDLGGYPSAELLLTRARAVRPDLALTAADLPTVVEICTRLDGIPLALELAATRVGAMTLEDIAARLSDDFEVLVARGRGRPERQQTMRATLEWSHELLSPAEKIVFRRLGAMAGSWTMSAAELICADELVAEPVVHLVSGLVDKSLVVLEVLDGEARYRMLMPVHEYAKGRLAASGESVGLRDRHSAFYVGRAELAMPELHGPDQVHWVRRLDRDLDNLRLAVLSAQARADTESVMRLVGALWWYLWLRGHLREGVRWLEPALGTPDVSPSARKAGLRAGAMLHGALGQSELAQEYARELRSLAVEAGDHAENARAATLLGLEALRAGDPAGATPYLEEALAEARSADDSDLAAHALVNLGAVAVPTQAEGLFREALAGFEEVGDGWGIAYASNYLAGLLYEQRQYDDAAQHSARAVRLLTEMGDRFYLIFAVEDLARSVGKLGRHDASARLLGAAGALRRDTGALLSPAAKAVHEGTVAEISARLGWTAFEQAMTEGARTDLDVLVDEALATTRPAPPGKLGGPGGDLTPREVDVARLLAAGLTNRQIAEKLVITSGTAGVHVEHILRKLDLRSRHQVAAWAQEQGVLEP